ncbi:MAG: hypothetical protein Q7S58_10905 [Candidatus Binatus sp.]|nr:N,N-dimethylformamidase beta subunit family domain-containing protein [Candidatus Binatus sp.]MDO8432904.1 hypothetical protein [Candidatus Binatus sp.]
MKLRRTVGGHVIYASLLVCVIVLYFQQVTLAQSQNPIQLENAKTGTTAWRLSNPATTRQIEGYASANSINRGDSISFFANTADPTFTLEVFRMGWYGGIGGRRITQPITLTGHVQTIPTPDPVTGMTECDWQFPYTIATSNLDPTQWVSGFYLVKLTGSAGQQRYIRSARRYQEFRSPVQRKHEYLRGLQRMGWQIALHLQQYRKHSSSPAGGAPA